MSETPPLVRQWILLRKLSALHYGTSVQELAKELDVTEKTIRRDLDAFAKAGFQLDQQVGARGKKTWRICTNGKKPELSFPLDEALALYLGRRFLEPLAGTLFWEATQNAFHKIRACLSPAALNYVEKMAANIHQTVVGSSDYSKKSKIIDNLMRGIEDCRATMITYKSLSTTEPVTYDIYPYALTYHRGSLYLVAHSPDHQDIRHFKVDRMEEATVTEFPFQRPSDFSVTEHLANSFGIYQGKQQVLVKVKFSVTVAQYVMESNWHSSQRLEKQRDGSLVAEFVLSDTEEIKRWVMGFGKEAEILAPVSLREGLAVELETMLSKYQQSSRKPGLLKG